MDAIPQGQCRLCLIAFNKKDSRYKLYEDLQKRLKDLGVNLHCHLTLPNTICKQCFRDVSKIENAMKIKKGWESNQSTQLPPVKRRSLESSENSDTVRKRLRDTSPEIVNPGNAGFDSVSPRIFQILYSLELFILTIKFWLNFRILSDSRFLGVS